MTRDGMGDGVFSLGKRGGWLSLGKGGGTYGAKDGGIEGWRTKGRESMYTGKFLDHGF